MGAQLYRPDVVAAAMRSTHANDTEESQAADVESVHLCQRYQALSGYSELDLGAMSLEDFRRIPDDFKFALLQAEKEVRNETYFYSWQLVADKFENIMRDFLLPERAV
ncbi:uncharacterized protein L201_007292 [Kwoniella dendrophila CBS 6074]|uniref:Uncharacterized protein n=1 Tax=Kwoniella dendrophila CBS 6074 TaxID=1295534 RepID=A0AAX4K6E7_9TREE